MEKQQLTFKEFDIVKKFENSNATVSELRTGVFAPIEKISSTSKTYTQFIENQKKLKQAIAEENKVQEWITSLL